MKIIFFGSDDFARAHLEALLNSSHDVIACVTQPDKARGRGMKVVLSPIKECAQEHDINVLQPEDLREDGVLQALKNLEADMFVVIAYGKFLPSKLLDVPKYFSINVHGSLLPQYRGAAPINWAIINGEQKTGLTIIKMNPKMDAGEIISQNSVSIDEQETAQTLRKKMIDVGAQLLLKTIEDIKNNSYSLTTQDESQVSFAQILTKDLGLIDWNQNAINIERKMRGLMPWPTAFTTFKTKSLKILEAQVLKEGFRDGRPGEIVELQKEGFVVVAGEYALLITKVHLENSKPMTASDFINGQRLELGVKLGALH